MEKSAKDRLSSLVSLHDVAKLLDKDVRTVMKWCYHGMRVPRGKMTELRPDGWRIIDGRVHLWRRRVGNSIVTTWEEVDRFLLATDQTS